MKKFLFTLLIPLMIVGCDKVTPQGSISDYDQSQLAQTFYADQTSGSSDFQFTASESWTTQIATKASDSWVTLTPASGGAGKVSMKIDLESNTTGADRSVEIHIVCGGASITLTIEQKGISNPDKFYVKRIVDNDGNAVEFSYDNQMRIVKMISDEVIKNAPVVGRATTERQEGLITYQDNKVIYSSSTELHAMSEELTLNDKGYVIGSVAKSGSMHSISSSEADQENHYTKEIAKFVYDADDHLSSVTNQSQCLNETCTTELNPSVSNCTWSNGNMTKVVYSYNVSEGTDVLEYSTEKNDTRYNIDLSYVFSRTEFYSLLGDGIIANVLGYMGVRSQYLPSRVTTGTSSAATITRKYTYKYTTDSKGRVVKCESQREGQSDVRKYTIEYMN